MITDFPHPARVPVALTATQAVAAAPTAIADPDIVKVVQGALLSKGYVDGGPPDGHLGDKTTDSILSFRARNDLPLTPTIDRELLDALAVAPPKAVDAKQATATAADIAPKVVAVNHNWWSRLWSKILAFPSLALALASAIIDHLDDATGKLSGLREFLSDVPFWVWPALVAVVALIISRTSGKVETSLVEGYQSGTVKNDVPAVVDK